jgi:hypothetical protein
MEECGEQPHSQRLAAKKRLTWSDSHSSSSSSITGEFEPSSPVVVKKAKLTMKPAVTLKHLSTKQKQAGGNNGGVGRKSTSSRMLTHFKQEAEEEWISSRANQKAECNECHAMVARDDRQVQLDYINTNIFLFYFI